MRAEGRLGYIGDMIVTAIVISLFGLVIGSFLNVCIHRIPEGRSIVTPRSACPKCAQPIAAYDNVPILSYLVLGGRGRCCKAPISPMYPAVEAVNGLLWVAVYLVYGLTLSALVYAAFASAMVVLAVIDAKHRILPHEITFGGLVVALLSSPWQAIHQQHQPGLARLAYLLGADFTAAPWVLNLCSALLGMAVGAGMLLVVAVGYYLVKKREGMGHGDIVMMGFVGAVLGWPLTLLTIFLGSFLGALVGTVLIHRAGGDRAYEIPFGTFLGAAAVIALLCGDTLLGWYWNLL